jgi:hypothetical protein
MKRYSSSAWKPSKPTPVICVRLSLLSYCSVIYNTSGIQPLFVRVPSHVISLQLCTPKVVGV